MSDEEIKKCLECCISLSCEGCPLKNNHGCLTISDENALALINRQQAEIERLKWEKDHFEFKVDDLNGKLEKFKEYRDIKNGAYEREIEKLQAVIDDLKHEIRNLECEKGQLEGTIDFLVAEAKSEAIKEFAEKLINKLDATHDMVNLNQKIVVTDTINMVKRLEKEMVGGENA